LSVATAVPATGQPVELTVKVSNVGDATATGACSVGSLEPGYCQTNSAS
jgi:uncharacterized repeat protein (TIGR01451 family)